MAHIVDTIKLFERLQNWLGKERVALKHSSRYQRVFASVVSAVCGAPPVDEDLEEVLWEEFTAVLDAFARRQVSHFLPNELPSTGLVSDPAHPAGAGFSPVTIKPLVSINDASEEDLTRVRGIGAVLARRIVLDRMTNGPFQSLGNLARIRGFSRQSYEQASPFLTVQRRSNALRLQFSDPAYPTFPEYIAFLLSGAAERPLEKRRNTVLPPECTLVELERAAKAASRNPYWQKDRLAPSLFLRVMAWGDASRRSHNRSFSARSPINVAILSNKQYFDRLPMLIDGAAKEILIAMHFVRADSNRLVKHLLDKLRAAHRRGCDVRLLVDSDADPARSPSSPLHTLTSSGVKVRVAALHIALHRKVVIIDDQVLVGSHNWTPSAAYRSEEASIYVRSVQVAQDETRWFHMLWDAEADAEADRRVALRLLRFIDPAEREVLEASGIRSSREVDAWKDQVLKNVDGQRFRHIRAVVAEMCQRRVPEALAHKMLPSALPREGIQGPGDCYVLAPTPSEGSRE